MAWTFNPFSGTFDQKGSGGGGGASYIDGEVAVYANLPLDGTAPLNSAWLVREASGVWPVSRKQAGIYIRTATGGSSRDADYTYAGTMPDVFSDAQFTLYGDVDSTKNVKFDVDAQVGANQTRVITVPNKNITLDDAGDSRTPTSHTHGNLTNAGAIGTTANLPLKTGTNGVVEAGSFGTSAGSFCEGNDARLSDDRDPNAHAASHAAGGSDPVTLEPSQITNLDSAILDAISTGNTIFSRNIQIKDAASDFTGKFRADDDSLTANRTYDLPDASGILALTSDIPTTASDIGAAASGSVTTSGLTQASARILGRTSSGTGAVEEIQIGSGLSLSAGELSATSSGGITAVGASTADVLSVSGPDLVADDAGADRIVFWDDSESKLRYLEAGTGLSISGTTLTATATGTIGGGTGSTDNSILRSDGTGGSTLQDSAFVIADNATASPNNTVNHASIQATGGSTNVSVSIVPKGTGAFMLQVPNAAAGGGNARGAGAVDLQTTRSAATQVASGDRSFIGAGTTNTASGVESVVCGGESNTASGLESVVCGGRSNTASNAWNFVGGGISNSASGGQTSVVCGGANNTASGAFEAFVGGGRGNTASGSGSVVCGGNDNLITNGNNIASSLHGAILGGLKGLADRFAIQAHSAGNFSGNVSNTSGEAQRIRAVLRCKTTTNAAVEMALNGDATYLTIPSGKVIFCNIKVVGVKSDGAVVATYERQYAAKNVAGTSSEVFAPVTIGTDNASSTSLEVATVDAGDYIRIRPTGITSEIWRWVASVDAVEVAYGT
jgi:hypothetical protein